VLKENDWPPRAGGTLIEHSGVFERLACSVVAVSRSAYRYEALPRDDEALLCLCAEVARLASRYGHHGYRIIGALFRNAGWTQASDLTDLLYHDHCYFTAPSPAARA